MLTFIKKPWGSEEILELNDNYMVKRLFMRAGHQCSVQKHQFKKETFVLLSGAMEFTFEDENGNVKTETLQSVFGTMSVRTVQPGQVHRMRAVTDIEYLEMSTPYPDDVIRLSDDYGREGTSDA